MRRVPLTSFVVPSTKLGFTSRVMVDRSNAGAVQRELLALRERVEELERSREELARAQRELEESEGRFRTLYHRTPVMMHSIDSEGNLVNVNDVWLEALGYRREEVLGKKVPQFLAEASRKFAVEEGIPRLLETGEVRDVELQFVRKNGEVMDVLGSAIAELDEKGRFRRSLTFFLDITERKRAEARFRHLVEQAADAFFLIDEESRVLDVNRRACESLGYHREELIGIRVEDFGSAPVSPAEVYKTIAPGGSLGMEGTHRRKDGSKFPVEVRIGAFEEGGRTLRVALARDITERKRLEDSLRRARDELEIRVRERTAELSDANAQLQDRMEDIARLKAQLERENVYLQEEIKIQHNFEEIVGRSRALQKVIDDIQTVAPTHATVLVTGETGTGKELVARALHNLSSQKKKPLVKVNCAALPASLIESELFGHEKGAFTGAVAQKIGRFELADGGTIFLDEIGDLPFELQAKLLRVLQEGEFERVGGSKTFRVQVRVIAATNRELAKAVSEEKFRADLYYRLNVFPIHVPPLPERVDDIEMLAAHFALKCGRKLGKPACEISNESMSALRRYSWPGNVRELENVIERAMIVSRAEKLELRDWLRSSTSPQGVAISESFSTLDEAQREHILSALERTGWQVGGDKGAAKLLGLKTSTLQARMKKLGIERKRH